MPDAKIHMSVFALKYPVGGRGGGVPGAADADDGDDHGAQEVSLALLSSIFLALPLSPLPPCQHTRVSLRRSLYSRHVHVHTRGMCMCILTACDW
jgi:hypothetical protein